MKSATTRISIPTWAFLAVTTLVLVAGCDADTRQQSETRSEADLEAAAMDWRERRLNRLTEPYGWLSLVGLDFVGDGLWRVGSDAQSDLVMPAGPELWGRLHIRQGVAEFEPEPGAAVEVDGEQIERARLHPTDGEEPIFVSAEAVRFQIISREGALAVRTRWPQARSLREFAGLDYFDFDPEWVVEARFESHPPGTTMPVGSVLGDIIDEPNPGAAVFEIDGREFRLEAVAAADGEQLFFILADRTSGRETYGAGRFLYADLPDEDGRTVLDFNRAYNPPCAFTEYSTCPLPPPENRLDIRVEAGELAYQGPGGWQPGDL